MRPAVVGSLVRPLASPRRRPARAPEGTQSDDAFGWGAPDSPQLRLLTGYVARESGNAELARGQLALAAAYYRGELDEPDEERERTPEWKAWVEALEDDAARV